MGTEKKLDALRKFVVQWENLHKLALRARSKTAIISNEEDERFQQIRRKIMPIYSELKLMLGRNVDPSEHVLNVVNRVSSLKQIIEMPDADKNVLFHRFDTVGSNLYEYGDALSPGSMGTRQTRSMPIRAVAALEKKKSEEPGKEEAARPVLYKQTFGAVWAKLMLDPVEFFDYTKKDHGLSRPVGFLFTLFLLIAIIMLVCSVLLFRETIITTSMTRMVENLGKSYWELAMYAVISVAIYMVITTVALFLMLLSSTWSQLCMKIVGGKGRYDHNYGIHCYTYAPHIFTPLYFILPILVIVPIAYQFILRILASAQVHKLSYTRAILGRILVLIPYLGCVYLLSTLEYKNHWNATVIKNSTPVLLNDNTSVYLPQGMEVEVEKHLTDEFAYIRAKGNAWEIEGRTSELCLEYPAVDFLEFLRLEMENLPVRISQFSSKLNIRILGREDKSEDEGKGKGKNNSR